ncbi:helix-turn-helix transcriptional regulator [Leminorella grimontii]|uniref:helix-turn-helix domain-containing protein n=1 Tax=Leminorella grimontii TaxID=82981 RepID=UPI0032205A27
MKSPQTYRNVFSLRLKQARVAKGFSQKRLGIEAGIDEFVASTRINRYEQGIHNVNTGTAQRLADALNVPVAYFYAIDDSLAELILAFNSLSQNERFSVLALTKEKTNALCPNAIQTLPCPNSPHK